MTCNAGKYKISFRYDDNNSLSGESVCKLHFQTAAAYNTSYHGQHEQCKQDYQCMNQSHSKCRRFLTRFSIWSFFLNCFPACGQRKIIKKSKNTQSNMNLSIFFTLNYSISPETDHVWLQNDQSHGIYKTRIQNWETLCKASRIQVILFVFNCCLLLLLLYDTAS